VAARLRPSRFEALAPESTAWLPRLASRAWSGDVYLAGGAALALYLGHRRVRDLDLMSGTNRLASTDRRDLLTDLLALEPAARVETARDGYLSLRLPDGPGLRFYSYPYPLADPEEEVAGLAVAAAVDLGLMKLGALISRGTRRDFVDLYLLDRELPLAALLARAGDKFGHVGDFALQAAKALADFSEAGDEPDTTLASPVDWQEVRAWALAAAREVAAPLFTTP
jgi:hypothetical protein